MAFRCVYHITIRTIHMLLKHQHGGDIHSFAKQINCHPSEVIDLSSNINFVKPSINFDFNTLEIAPYPNYEKLQNSIAKLYQIQSTQLELFNGATSAIYSLFRLLKPKHATLYAPLYLEYEKALKITRCDIDQVNRFQDIYKEVKKSSLVIFVNPSTPDGKYYDLNKLMKIWMEKNCIIVIDESFLDFTPYKSIISYLKKYSKLYILKSMTKFYAAAGIRVGALLSNEKNIQAINEHEPLWKISEFDSHYLQEALKDEKFKLKAQQQNEKVRKKLVNILEHFSYTKKIYTSQANFILVQLTHINAFTLQEELIPFKIMIRNCKNFKFLDEYHVRLALKSNQNIESLKMALEKLYLYK